MTTRHLEAGEPGVRISRQRYNAVRAAILVSLREGGDLTHSALVRLVTAALQGKFSGFVPWYVEVVRLDLEARGMIERVPETRPQMFRMKGTSH